MKQLLPISSLVIIVLLGLSFSPLPTNRQEFEISKNLEIFATLYKELHADYVDELDPNKVMRDGIDAMLKNLDPFTNYIPESDIERYRLLREGTFNAVGAEYKKIDDYVTFTELYAGQSADQAGIKIGDQILSIDGKDVKGKSADEVDFFLRGAKGTAVEMVLRRPGQATDLKVKITRDELEQPNVPYSGLVDNDIAYVALSTFSQDAGRNVANALADLRKKNPELKGIILDLRNNGGGLLLEAVNLCNVFIPKGELVVTTKGKLKENSSAYRTNNTAVEAELPLAVLIDKYSASASEIVSGVIQDYDRGVLIGQRSYGKGLVQNTTDVGYNSKLKLTTAKYYIPSGRCIQSVEYKNGEPVDIPEAQRNVFRTRNNREVRDGGGVLPDIKIAHPGSIPVIKTIQDQDLIFRFVTQYQQGKPAPASIDDLNFQDFAAFVQFLQKDQTIFRTEAEKTLETLRNQIKSEGYNLSTLAALEKELTNAQLEQLNQNKALVNTLIEKEIANRYFYVTGKIQLGLLRDQEVKEAIKVLRDPSRYKQILGKQ